jgi:hypothetical protein
MIQSTEYRQDLGLRQGFLDCKLGRRLIERKPLAVDPGNTLARAFRHRWKLPRDFLVQGIRTQDFCLGVEPDGTSIMDDNQTDPRGIARAVAAPELQCPKPVGAPVPDCLAPTIEHKHGSLFRNSGKPSPLPRIAFLLKQTEQGECQVVKTTFISRPNHELKVNTVTA